ncbi:MAG: hypothetical protein ACE5HA_08790 [Anaerolineae bacterium]
MRRRRAWGAGPRREGPARAAPAWSPRPIGRIGGWIPASPLRLSWLGDPLRLSLRYFGGWAAGFLLGFLLDYAVGRDIMVGDQWGRWAVLLVEGCG